MDIPPAAGFRCRAWSHSSSMLDTEDICLISPPIIGDHVAWGALVATLQFVLALGKVASVLGRRRPSLWARFCDQYCEDHFASSRHRTKHSTIRTRLTLPSASVKQPYELSTIVSKEHNVIRPREPEEKGGTYTVRAPHRWLLGMHVQLAASDQACVFPNAAVYGWNSIVNAPPQR